MTMALYHIAVNLMVLMNHLFSPIGPVYLISKHTKQYLVEIFYFSFEEKAKAQAKRFLNFMITHQWLIVHISDGAVAVRFWRYLARKYGLLQWNLQWNFIDILLGFIVSNRNLTICK